MTNSNYYVYILLCKDDTFYCGITNDLANRIEMHNKKTASKYTRGRTPVNYIYYEEVSDKSSALKRELEIKALNKEKKIDLIESDLNLMNTNPIEGIKKYT